jgi:serine protease Do
MKRRISNLILRARFGLLGGALAVAVAGLALTGFGEAKKDVKNPPAHFKVDSSAITRQGNLTTSYAPVVKQIAPSVVNVFTTTKPKRVNQPYAPFFEDPFFRRFFGDSTPEMRAPKQHGLGSGVIVTEDGYILTNNHVVDGADEIKVAMSSDKKQYPARVVGTDPKSDVAVLKIEEEGLPVAKLGNSDDIEVGDVVLAIGNPFGVGQSVSQGIVSATRRAAMGLDLDYEDFIQTDAAINPGNSGGALVDAEGRLIGINTAILSRSGGNQGIGFAVPINLAKSVMESLISEGRVVRGFLGVTIQDVTPGLAKEFDLKSAQGALVSEVMPKTPAARAGFKSGDVVLEFNGKEIRGSRHLKLEVAQTPPGSEVPVKILRDGKTKELQVTLKELPKSDELAQNSSGAESSSDALNGVVVSDLNSTVRERLDLPKDIQGAVVTGVDPDSAAYEAGLREGDIIREINRKPVKTAADAVAMTKNMKDKTILLRIWSKRTGGNLYLVVDESKAG